MKLLALAPKSINNFLHTFIATYKNEEGQFKEYEVITRNKKLRIEDFGNNSKVDAVGIIVFNEDKSKILLLKEFRLACNEWVYNFPGGLIDSGETAADAAKRELQEETGLNLYKIEKTLGKAYTAVGISNEAVVTLIGYANGEFQKSTSADEEIEPAWYSKDEAKKLLENNSLIASKTQLFLWMWVNS